MTEKVGKDRFGIMMEGVVALGWDGMRTWNVDIQKIRAMASANGAIRVQVDAAVQPAAPAREGATPTSLLTFDEETARVMLLLLKAQLAELDAKKPKSRRG